MAIKLWSGEGDSSNELIEKLVIEALKQVQWLKLEEIAALEKIFPLNSSPHAKTGHQKVRYHVDDTLWG